MKREVCWPVLLIATMFCWVTVFSFEVQPIFGLRWLQVACGLFLFVNAAMRIWNGRFEA